MKWIFSILLITGCSTILFSQEGFQMGINGQASISSILNQNNYGDPTGFEPSYQFTRGYDIQIKAGYNFLPYVGIFVSGGRSWGGQDYADQNKFGKHKKQIDLSYYYTELFFRYNPILERNHYKTKQKIRTEINIGFRVARLTSADARYQLNGKNRGFPFRIEEFNYAPVSNDKDLFKKFEFGLVAKVGVNWYITERLYLDPGVKLYIGLNDMNSEKYTVHDDYASSRNFAVGLNVGLNYYITYKSIR